VVTPHFFKTVKISKMEKFIYNPETNLSDDMKTRQLHHTLYYPKAEELIGYISQAMKHKNADFRFFGKTDVWPAVNNIIRNCYDKSKDQGVIHVNYLYTAVEEVAELVDRIKFWKSLADPKGNKGCFERQGVQFIESGNADERFIAVGSLEEDYKDGDSDCYETAGGYRSYVATQGSTVEVRLNTDLTVRCSFDSHCVVDHYNNNFFGVSTGNGTTEYELGQRVEKRGVTMGREFIDKTWSKRKANVDIKLVDAERVLSLIRLWYPELASVILGEQLETTKN
jgi:hypothetical protein